MHESTRNLVRLALARVLARQERGAGSPVVGPSPTDPASDAAPVAPEPRGEVCLASDHGGFELKEALVRGLRAAGYRVRDLGPTTKKSCDYPDYALQVARWVALGLCWRGIMVDGVGIGSAMAAGKVPGVRAATCFDDPSTKNARGHNNANVMCIGSRTFDAESGLRAATIFLETPFEGGRHARRVTKIHGIERTFSRCPGCERTGSCTSRA